eukprot:COSAG01_NODE_166_length_23296_cov_140.506014_5_plen_117_part_00
MRPVRRNQPSSSENTTTSSRAHGYGYGAAFTVTGLSGSRAEAGGTPAGRQKAHVIELVGVAAVAAGVAGEDRDEAVALVQARRDAVAWILRRVVRDGGLPAVRQPHGATVLKLMKP